MKIEITPPDVLSRPVLILDPNDSTKQLMAYVQDLTGRIGMQVLNKFSLCRIKKLTTDSGKGLTDSLIDQAQAKFQGRGPDVCFMTKRSAQQLKSSRTATTPTGVPAEWATQLQGLDGRMIPIYVTDAISNTETLAL